MYWTTTLLASVDSSTLKKQFAKRKKRTLVGFNEKIQEKLNLRYCKRETNRLLPYIRTSTCDWRSTSPEVLRASLLRRILAPPLMLLRGAGMRWRVLEQAAVSTARKAALAALSWVWREATSSDRWVTWFRAVWADSWLAWNIVRAWAVKEIAMRKIINHLIDCPYKITLQEKKAKQTVTKLVNKHP